MTPILVMGIAAGHSTQLLKRYYEELKLTDDSRAAVERSLIRLGPVMLAAGVTAALGFASLAVFRVPSLRTFGIFTALGILCGLAVELSFMPALRCLVRSPAAVDAPFDRAIARTIGRLARSLRSGPHWPYLSVFALIGTGAVVGVFAIRADFSLIAYLPRRTEGAHHFAVAQRLFPGTLPLVILIEGKDEIAQDPRLVRLVAGLESDLRRRAGVVRTASYVDVLEEVAASLRMTDGRAGRALGKSDIAQLLYLSYSPQYGLFTYSRFQEGRGLGLSSRDDDRAGRSVDGAREGVRRRHPPPG